MLSPRILRLTALGLLVVAGPSIAAPMPTEEKRRLCLTAAAKAGLTNTVCGYDFEHQLGVYLDTMKDACLNEQIVSEGDWRASYDTGRAVEKPDEADRPKICFPTENAE